MSKLITTYIIITLILIVVSIYTNRQDKAWKNWKYLTLPIICVLWGVYFILTILSLFKIEFADKILNFIDRLS